MQPAVRIFGRTRNEWLALVERVNIELSRLESARHMALEAGEGERAKAMELDINIAKGTLLAANQVLTNPPFGDVENS